MATVGQQLTAPESGWRRYDDTDSRILYAGSKWVINTNNPQAYKGGDRYIPEGTSSLEMANHYIIFRFYGSKIRCMTTTYTQQTTDLKFIINGKDYGSGNQGGSLNYQILIYESLSLGIGFHEVKIYSGNGIRFSFDSIDIDSDGYLVHPKLIQRIKLEDMEIGDCIPCKYTATTAGAVGYFSELGACIADEIPVTGTATPNGLFYFYKLDTGKLGADRVLQTNISWDALNAAKYIEGRYKPTNIKQSPVAHLPLNSATTLQSIYGTNYLSSITGTLTLSASPYGQAVYFNGASRINCNSKLIPIGAKSIRFKMNSASFADGKSRFLFSNVSDGSAQYGFGGIALGADRLWFYLAGGPTGPVIDSFGSNTVVADNKWHDVLFTWDGTLNTNSVKLYIDGVLNNQTTASKLETTQPTYNLTIGSLYGSQGGGNYIAYTGYLSNLEIYNYVITPDELEYSVRSFSGGNSYLSADGLPKLTDQGLGAWPQNNEWDTYVVKSDLGGKVTPGDDVIWHYNNRSSLAKDTVVTGFTRGDTAVADSTHRMLRSINIGPTPSLLRPWFVGSSIVDTIVGFRPLVEYKHEKQITSWY